MIFIVSDLFKRIYAMCELWETDQKFEIAKNASYLHSKLCGHPVFKKELANSDFNPVKKIHKRFPLSFDCTERHPCNRIHRILNYKPSKILEFPNMTRLWEVITFLLGRVEKKSGPSLRIYATRSFDCAYFQPHRSTPSGRKSVLNIFNFGNFRNPQCVHP